MGIAIGILLIASSMLLLGGCIGRWTAPDRKVRKSDLNDARRTLSEIHRITRNYSDQLDIVGRLMQTEIQDEINEYWEGVRVI